METQGPLALQDQPDEPPTIDLNRATSDELITLPGIGAALSERIITYRQVHGPFTNTSQLTNVSGIGPTALARIAGRVAAIPLNPAGLAAEDDLGIVRSTSLDVASSEPAWKDGPLPEGHVESEPSEEVPTMLEHDTSAIAEEAVSGAPEFPPAFEATPVVAVETAETEVAPLEINAPGHEPEEVIEDRPEPAPEGTPEPPAIATEPQRRNWTWLWSSLLGAVLGGLLGLLLALLIFAGINGSVDVRRSSAFRSLSSQANGLSVEIDAVRADVSTLQGDIDGLRQRVEVLSGLTVRMDQAESTIDTFGGEIDTLQASVSALTQDMDDLGEAVDTLKLQSAQTMSFFEQLRALLEGIFGGKEPQSAIPNPGGVN